jgi:hypothetical protein
MVEDSPQTWIEKRLKDIVTGGIFLKNNVDGIGPKCSVAWRSSGGRQKDAWWKLRKLRKILLLVRKLLIGLFRDPLRSV